MFTLFGLLSWCAYGLLVGCIAKAIFRADDGLQGWVSTILLGVAGSCVGGLINWAMNMGGPYHPAGIILSIVGGILCCWAWRAYHLNNLVKKQALRIQELEKK